MIGNYSTVGAILIQILTGLLGSLIAGAFIAIISERRFNRTVKTFESNITSALDPINKTVFTIAEKTKRLPELVPAISTIGNEIKRLAEVVDRMREGLEKAK
jgi:hypothetical protein